MRPAARRVRHAPGAGRSHAPASPWVDSSGERVEEGERLEGLEWEAMARARARSRGASEHGAVRVPVGPESECRGQRVSGAGWISHGESRLGVHSLGSKIFGW